MLITPRSCTKGVRGPWICIPGIRPVLWKCLRNPYLRKKHNWGDSVHLSYIIILISYYIYTYGYGSIPIHTIFSGMDIHLPAILMWTTGVQGFDTLRYMYNLCLTVKKITTSRRSAPPSRREHRRARHARSAGDLTCAQSTGFRPWAMRQSWLLRRYMHYICI